MKRIIIIIAFILSLYIPQTTKVTASFVDSTQIVVLQNGEELSFPMMKRMSDPEMQNFLQVKIEADQDVMIKLMKVGKKKKDTCIRAVYIRGYDSLKIENIPRGSYYMKISYGNSPAKTTIKGETFYQFTSNIMFKQTSNIMKFAKTVKKDKAGDYYTFENYTVTLKVSGNEQSKDIDTKEISAEDFLK
jgi:hypothetical protein